MVPLLGGAFSACVYHFFYNSPKLDALVALQVTSLPAILPVTAYVEPSACKPTSCVLQTWRSHHVLARRALLWSKEVTAKHRTFIWQRPAGWHLVNVKAAASAVMQAALTFLGNGTCALAAYRIYKAGQDGSSARQ